MSVTIKGSAGPELVSAGKTYDPETGWRTERVYKMLTSGSAHTLLYQLQEQGWAVNYEKGEGPGQIIRAQIGRDIDEETTATTESSEYKWTWRKEYTAKSVFEHPSVLPESIGDWALYMADSYPTSSYKKAIEDSIQGNTDVYDAMVAINASTSSAFTQLANVHHSIYHGHENYEDTYYTLRLTINSDLNYTGSTSGSGTASVAVTQSFRQMGDPYTVFSPGYFFSASVSPAYLCPSNVKDVFPTAALESASVIASMSVFYNFGWRERGNEGEIVGTKFSQTIDWTLAWWSKLTYPDFIS